MASGTLVTVDGVPPAPVPTPVEVTRASDEEVAAVVSGRTAGSTWAGCSPCRRSPSAWWRAS
ncbi:hypothetical protein GCM10025788_10900 [Serinicoccus chungangensis]